MASGPCTRLQSHLSVFLETTSVAVDEFQPLVLAFAAVLQAQMAYCGALPCLDTSDTLPADDLIGINSREGARRKPCYEVVKILDKKHKHAIV